MLTLSRFRKLYVISKSHNIKGGYISVTYTVNFANSKSAEQKVIIKKHGGALRSLFYHETGILL